MVDAKLARGRLDGYRYADMPDDRETWRLVARGLDEVPPRAAPTTSPRAGRGAHDDRRRLRGRRARRRRWNEVDASTRVVGRDARRAVGVLLAPVGVERDRLRRPRLPARLHAPAASGRRAREPVRGRPRRSTSIRCPTSRAGRVDEHRLRRVCKGACMPRDNDSASLLDVHAARHPRRDADAALPRRRGGRPADRRRRRRRLACSPSGWPGAGWRVVDPRVRAVLGPRPRLGLRRGRPAPALLDGAAGDRRRGPGRARQEQLRARRRRLDDPLRGLHAALPPLRLRDPHARRRRRRLADRLRRPQAALRARRARAAGRGPGLAVGRPARLPARGAPDLRRGRPGAGAARSRPASRCASARSAIPNGVFGNRPHCIYRGFCLQGCKVNAKALAARHAPARRDRARRRGARGRARRAGRDRRDGRAAPASTYVRDGRERFQRAAAVVVCGLLDRDARGCCSTRRAALPDGLATTTTRSAAT